MKRIGELPTGEPVYASANLVRVGPKGPGVTAPELFGSMSKSQARPLRKLLYREGYTWLAAAPRSVVKES